MMAWQNCRFACVSKRRLRNGIVVLLLVTSVSFLFSFVSAGAAEFSVRQLRVLPDEIQLGGKNCQQQLLVTAELEDGVELDVTRSCKIRVGGEIASLQGTVLTAVRDGRNQLTVEYANQQIAIPLQVTGYDAYPAVDFVGDVMPLLTKYNCNGGGCHGKQGGQNGFQLSVFGFDPAADHAAITRQSRGRRLSPAAPIQSLFLRKATGLQAHGGGQRIDTHSLDARLLTEWIDQGAVFDLPNSPSLTRINVVPVERILGVSTGQQLLVTAHYSDGTSKDVTSDATYTSNAEFIADVNASGLIQAGTTPGEAGITVAYMGNVAVSRILIPRPSSPTNVAPTYLKPSADNRIDQFVLTKLKKMGIVASEPCDDATFLRRLYIDTIGTLPTVSEVKAFLSDTDDAKRTLAIDKVLSRSEYADYWAQRWADVLLVDRKKLGERGSYEFHRWLRSQLEQNRPYDRWVRELLTASGNSARYGPVNYFRALRTPEERTRAVSQAFLGVRLDCAQCHHHPFDKWSQRDFYGLAGFFNGIELRQIQADRELLFYRAKQPARMPHTGETITPRPLDGEPLTAATDDPRLRLAEWLTDDNNPWFARVAVNRVWKHFLGRGLVEPEDDLRLTNPPTNAPLLAYLEESFVESSYDLKHLIRLILRSQTYQLSSVPNETNADDSQNFSHYYVKRLRADVLLDAICQSTGTPERYAGMPIGTRAIQLWDNRLPSYFLDTFGRSQRESPCECGTSGQPTMAQTLHLMNAPEINDKISAPGGKVAQLLRQGMKEEEFVEELSLCILGRPATAKEHRVASQLFTSASRKDAGEDFLWTLLNSYDFLFVH